MTYHSSISASDQASTSVSSASINGVLVAGVTYSVSNNVLTVSGLFSSSASGEFEIVLPTFFNPPTT